MIRRSTRAPPRNHHTCAGKNHNPERGASKSSHKIGLAALNGNHKWAALPSSLQKVNHVTLARSAMRRDMKPLGG
jgi:hypothetical protein